MKPLAQVRVSGFELKSIFLQSLFITDTTVPLTIQGGTLVKVYCRKDVYGLLRGTERLLEKIAWTKVEGRLGNRSLGDGGPCNGL